MILVAKLLLRMVVLARWEASIRGWRGEASVDFDGDFGADVGLVGEGEAKGAVENVSLGFYLAIPPPQGNKSPSTPA